MRLFYLGLSGAEHGVPKRKDVGEIEAKKLVVRIMLDYPKVEQAKRRVRNDEAGVHNQISQAINQKSQRPRELADWADEPNAAKQNE